MSSLILCKINTGAVSRPRARKRVKVSGNWGGADDTELKNEVKNCIFVLYMFSFFVLDNLIHLSDIKLMMINKMNVITIFIITANDPDIEGGSDCCTK